MDALLDLLRHYLSNMEEYQKENASPDPVGGSLFPSSLLPSNGEDLFFLGVGQLVDFGYEFVGKLLHLGLQALDVVLGGLSG